MNKFSLNLLLSTLSIFSFFSNIDAQNTNCDHPDYDALVAIYNTTDGANWNNKWDLSDCNVCDWTGVFCNEERRVIQIRLGSNNLKGSLPDEIGNLTNLQRLILTHNQLIGNIPTSLQNLTDLRYINLTQNQLTGIIPSELGEIESLSGIDLRQNELTGSIPSSLGKLKNLLTLDLSFNNLTGRIPKELAQIPVKALPVMSIQLNDNNLSDCYYRELKRLCEVFDILKLHNNPNLPDGGGTFQRNSLCQGTGGEEILCKTTANCDNVRFGINPYELTVNGLVVTSTVTLFGENTNWRDSTLAGCFKAVCGDSVTIRNLIPGEYIVKIQQSATDGSFCYLEETIIIPDTVQTPPIDQTTGCDLLSFSTNANQIILDGLAGIYNKVEILGKNTDWEAITICEGDCADSLIIPDLEQGEYAVKVNLVGNDGNYCYREEKIVVNNNNIDVFSCEDLIFISNDQSILIEGLSPAYDKVEIIGQNTDWQVVPICDKNCEETQIIPDLTFGAYTIKVLHGNIGEDYCYREEKVVVGDNSESRNGSIDFEKELILFPNPARNQISLQSSIFTGKEGHILIYNAFGQLLESFSKKSFNNDAFSINLNGYENGIYMIAVKVENMPLFSKRFIVEHLK